MAGHEHRATRLARGPDRLFALTQFGRPPLLQHLFGTVALPPAVPREIAPTLPITDPEPGVAGDRGGLGAHGTVTRWRPAGRSARRSASTSSPASPRRAVRSLVSPLLDAVAGPNWNAESAWCAARRFPIRRM